MTTARRVVLAVPAELADTVPARRVMFTTPGRWKCGKWHPPVDHTVREAYAVCVGRRKRPARGVRSHEWVVVAWFLVKSRAYRCFSKLDERGGRALVCLESPDVDLVHAVTGAAL